jgi:hypothetical protein
VRAWPTSSFRMQGRMQPLHNGSRPSSGRAAGRCGSTARLLPIAWGALAMAYAVRKRVAPISERSGLDMRSRAAASRALQLDGKESRALAALRRRNVGSRGAQKESGAADPVLHLVGHARERWPLERRCRIFEALRPQEMAHPGSGPTCRQPILPWQLRFNDGRSIHRYGRRGWAT